jgi:hypothetical protein
MASFVFRLHTPVLLLGLAFALTVPTASGQWVEAPGTGWVQLQIAHQQTRDGFDEEGDVVPLVQTPGDDGQSVITTVRFTGALGLLRGVDAWVDVPYHRQAFNTSRRESEDVSDVGFGDPRVYLRVAPSLLGIDAVPVALRGGAKFTSGNFRVRSDAISLSEGQRDWELLLEVGTNLHPWPVYVMGWAGYRWRERNEKIGRDPGGERLFFLAAGGNFGRFQWKLAVDGLMGTPSTRQTAAGALELPPREFVQVIPTLGWKMGPGSLQVGGRIPVHGQSTRANQLPAAPTVTIGYFLSWERSFW